MKGRWVYKRGRSYGAEYIRKIASQDLSNLTYAQKRSLVRLAMRNPKGLEWVDVPPNPANEHVAVGFCGMYVGIEPDGYTHS